MFLSVSVNLFTKQTRNFPRNIIISKANNKTNNQINYKISMEESDNSTTKLFNCFVWLFAFLSVRESCTLKSLTLNKMENAHICTYGLLCMDIINIYILTQFESYSMQKISAPRDFEVKKNTSSISLSLKPRSIVCIAPAYI